MKHRSVKLFGHTFYIGPMASLSLQGKKHFVRLLWYWLGTKKVGIMVQIGKTELIIVDDRRFNVAYAEAMGQQIGTYVDCK